MMLLAVLAVLLIAALLAALACARLLANGTIRRPRQPSRRGLDAESAYRRHPATRSRQIDPAFMMPGLADTEPSGFWPAGPDDDPEFIRELGRRIRGDADPTA